MEKNDMMIIAELTAERDEYAKAAQKALHQMAMENWNWSSCASTDEKRSAYVELQKALEASKSPATDTSREALIGEYQELNMSNYGHDDVNRLNNWAIRAFDMLEADKREPLSMAELHALWLGPADGGCTFSEFTEVVRATEAAHNIKAMTNQIQSEELNGSCAVLKNCTKQS
jgi:hypothetical protein